MRAFLIGFFTCICIVHFHADLLGKDGYLKWADETWTNTHWSIWIWIWMMGTYLLTNFTIEIK